MTATAEDVVGDALAPHPSIGLAELDAVAALQTRIDRKYVLTLAETDAFLRGLDADARVLEIDGVRASGYASTYFDTDDLLTFHLAAHRRRRRFKVRTRTYVDTGGTFLEVKTRAAGGVTVKERRAHPVTDELGEGVTFVDDRLDATHLDAPPASGLVPVLRTHYRRTTVLLSDARVTVDTGLAWRLAGQCGAASSGTTAARATRAALGDLVVVETKSGTAPSSADRLLWRSGHRPDRISKYATGLALLRPDLPDHPWRRLLRELRPAA